MAVVVLYKMDMSESKSVRSLLHVLEERPDLARHFSLIVYDNSPNIHAARPASKIAIHYQHDPTNAGLAFAYNYALARAAESRHEWLLLLDQDTSLTSDFFVEMVARTVEMAQQQSVAAIVPRLVVNGKIHSPAAHFIDQLRRQYKRSVDVGSKDVLGVQQGRLSVYNSGATLRVSALEAIGGFPREYWLDYLDHAVFDSLRVHGFSIFIMNSMLDHDASQADLSTVPVWRERNILFAQTRFVRQTGNLFDLLLYRVWLLRSSRCLLRFHPDKRLWKEALLQALLLKETSTDREHRELPTRPAL